MAKRFLRLSKLGPEERNIFLQSIGINPAAGIPEDNAILNEFEKTGKVPDQITNNSIRSQLEALPKDNPQLLNTFTDQKVDESSLTDEELQNRLAAFEGQNAKPKPYVDQNKIYSEALTQLLRNGVPENLSIQEARRIAQYYSVNKALPDARTSTLMLDLIPHLGRNIEAGNFNSLTPEVSKSEDQTRIQDMLSGREATRTKESAIDSYLNTLPNELSASTNEFLKGEEDSAYGALEKQVPIVQQDLNTRGMLFSGEVSDSLTTRALSLDSELSKIRFELEQADNQFYYDAAYKNALRKSISATEDYRSAIASDRSKVLTDRNQKYQSYQSELDRTLDEDIKRSSYQRELAVNRQKAKDAQEQAKTERERGVITGLVTTAANIGGNILGNAAVSKKTG